MTTFALKTGDLEPPLRATFLEDDGTPVDLTQADSVHAIVRKHDATTPIIDRAATIVTPPTAGRVELTWQDGDTNTAGRYHVEFRIVWAPGRVQTIPAASQRPETIYIRDDLRP